jgi:hypothetical protein
VTCEHILGILWLIAVVIKISNSMTLFFMIWAEHFGSLPFSDIRLKDFFDEDDCFLRCCTVQSARSLPTFQRCLLPPSSGTGSLVFENKY